MFNRGINIYAELNLPHCNIIDMISLLSLVLKEEGGGRGGGDVGHQAVIIDLKFLLSLLS